MGISLQHPGTGRVKMLPEGWSWSCFFGATLLGLPLFRLGLTVWGSAMLVFDLVTLIVGFVDTDAAASLYFWLSLLGLAASVFFGATANAMAAQHALPTAGSWPTGIGGGSPSDVPGSLWRALPGRHARTRRTRWARRRGATVVRI